MTGQHFDQATIPQMVCDQKFRQPDYAQTFTGCIGQSAAIV